MEKLLCKRSDLGASTYFVALEAKSVCHGFYDDACYKFYLLRLFHCLNFYHIKLHAYVLLPDKMWLLVTPGSTAGLRNLLAFVNRAYCNYFNTRFARTIHRWHKNFTEQPILRDSLVMACQRHMESEPVRRGLVAHPGVWRWSSYNSNSFGGGSRFVTKHRAFRQFFQSVSDPGVRYRAYVSNGLIASKRHALHTLLLCESGQTA